MLKTCMGPLTLLPSILWGDPLSPSSAPSPGLREGPGLWLWRGRRRRGEEAKEEEEEEEAGEGRSSGHVGVRG